jgi:hypothetical protein
MHQAIELLLKRMESNPEEFSAKNRDRWMRIVKRYDHLFNEEESAALRTRMREIDMGEFHKELMAELLYGDERRREEAEAIEEKRMEMLRMQSAMGPLMQSAHRVQAAQGLQNSRLIGNDVTASPLFGSITSSNTRGSSYAAHLQIDDETIDSSLIKKLKALLTKETK